MAVNPKYNARYENSWGLVVGINAYRHASPLSHASNDAIAVAEVLINKFGFPTANIIRLLDEEATLERVRAAMAGLVRRTAEDDRVIIFYAGHGHTLRGNRRDSGYLVPVEGKCDDTSTLLPWDELVSTGNVIPAKHILYIMDACYGGMIAMRKPSPGSARLARDMLSRYSRQYLTAGKADEEVADGGGPRQGHSMFTGHFLEAFEDMAAASDGLVTANTIMPYVYGRVATDPHSQQTPHYGYLEGDGDFFFTDPKVESDSGKLKDDENTLIQVPVNLTVPEDALAPVPLLEQVKVYLSDQRYRIQLNDLMMRELRAAQQKVGDDRFPLQGGTISGQEIAARLQQYEEVTAEILRIAVLLGKWADEKQQGTIVQILNVFSGEIDAMKGGRIVWLGLRSYPTLMTMYAGGIAAIDGDNYRSLKTLFGTPVLDRLQRRSTSVLQATVSDVLEVDRTDAFKAIPGFENKYAPRSEYLFTRIQPIVEDLLFLGTRYEQLFDRFEILYALSFADLQDDYWGPPGRFGWKRSGRAGIGIDPFNELLEEAKRDGERWAPLQAGMFRGSYARFAEVAERYKVGLLDKLSWR